jgi:hypothetical protein
VKFLFDHDVPDDLAYALQASGHEVQLLRTVLPVTTPDDEILRLAHERDEAHHLQPGRLPRSGPPNPSCRPRCADSPPVADARACRLDSPA